MLFQVMGLIKCCAYHNQSNNLNKKLNNFISGVRILWNTLINNFSRKRGGVLELLAELFEN